MDTEEHRLKKRKVEFRFDERSQMTATEARQLAAEQGWHLVEVATLSGSVFIPVGGARKPYG